MALCEVLEVVVVRLPVVEDVVVELVGEVVELPDEVDSCCYCNDEDDDDNCCGGGRDSVSTASLHFRSC